MKEVLPAESVGRDEDDVAAAKLGGERKDGEEEKESGEPSAEHIGMVH
jgi:hypothetical protein